MKRLDEVPCFVKTKDNQFINISDLTLVIPSPEKVTELAQFGQESITNPADWKPTESAEVPLSIVVVVYLMVSITAPKVLII